MSHAHSPAEWAEMGLLSVGIVESASVFYHLFVDADPADFDPRRVVVAVRRAAWSGSLDRLLMVVANVKYDARETAVQAREFVADVRSYAVLSLREAALSVAALLALLTITPEHR